MLYPTTSRVSLVTYPHHSTHSLFELQFYPLLRAVLATCSNLSIAVKNLVDHLRKPQEIQMGAAAEFIRALNSCDQELT